MHDQIKHLVHQENYSLIQNNGISFVTVYNEDAGNDLAKKILYDIVSPQTVLYLSGGKSPKDLYSDFSKDEKMIPGASALVDERYGDPFHENSNELMVRESGLLRYFHMRDIPFYSILQGSFRPRPDPLLSYASQAGELLAKSESAGEGREETARLYDQKIRELFATYQKHIAILGIGMDGHTAGIPADPSVWDEFRIKGRSETEMVIDFDDHGKFYNQRVTMSFLALSMMDVLLVLVFGSAKQNALEWMFAEGPEDEVPSRFFKRPDIAKKTILITDQKV